MKKNTFENATPSKKKSDVIRAPKRPSWFTTKKKSGGCFQSLNGVIIGNQVILELSHQSGRYSKYFVVEDEKTGWAYLVWDLNTPGGPFHGKFKKGKK